MRPTIPTEEMLGVAQDNYMFKAFCAVFLTYHTGSGKTRGGA